MLTPECLEYGSSGRVFTRDEVLELLACEEPICIQLSDYVARLLAPHVAIVTWRAIRPDGTQSLRSSLWIRRDGRWQMLFHQGTPVPHQ